MPFAGWLRLKHLRIVTCGGSFGGGARGGEQNLSRSSFGSSGDGVGSVRKGTSPGQSSGCAIVQDMLGYSGLWELTNAHAG